MPANPPLPKGFTAVDEAPGKSPPLPKGFTPVDAPKKAGKKPETSGVEDVAARFVKGSREFYAGVGQSVRRLVGDEEGAAAIHEDMEARAAADAAKYGDGGTTGDVAEFVGNALPSLRLPFAGAQKVFKGGSLAAKAGNVGVRGAKNAPLGFGVGATAGTTATGEEQVERGLVGAAATVALVPAFEKVFGAFGSKIGEVFENVSSRGYGKKIVDSTTGQLTAFGHALRTRLKAINRDLPDELIDEALAQIQRVDPKRLPKDEDIVPEFVAQSQDVPLTGAMKTRDVRGIQNFERIAATDAYGKGAQETANDMNRAIDEKIVENVRGIGSGKSTAQAGEEIGGELVRGKNAAKKARDDLYEPLKTSKEPVAAGSLKKIVNDFAQGAGQGGVDTLGDTTKRLLIEVNQMAKRKGNFRFGQLWNFSRKVNAAYEHARTSKGADIVELGDLKKAVDGYMSEFAKGGSEAAKQLKAANTAHAKYVATFGQRNARSVTGRGVVDKAGKSVETIIAKAENGALNPTEVENIVFGAGKAMDTSGAKQAATTMKRIVRAAPQLQGQLKDITVNRIASQIESGFAEKSMKPETLQKLVKQAVDGNRAVLEAAGFSAKDITRLQANAYLASLKAAPSGARNVGSGKFNVATARNAFRGALKTALGIAGAATGGVGGVPALAVGGAAYGAAEVADRVATKRLVNRATSAKVPLRPNAAGKRVGKTVGRAVGAQTAREASKG